MSFVAKGSSSELSITFIYHAFCISSSQTVPLVFFLTFMIFDHFKDYRPLILPNVSMVGLSDVSHVHIQIRHF